jgi:hypothetical protein
MIVRSEMNPYRTCTHLHLREGRAMFSGKNPEPAESGDQYSFFPFAGELIWMREQEGGAQKDLRRLIPMIRRARACDERRLASQRRVQ